MDCTNNDAILERFPPCLRKNIQEVWANGKIGTYKMEVSTKSIVLTNDEFKGISGMNISLVPFPNKRITKDYYEPYAYQFLLKVPYAGRLLEWEIIFNEEDFGFAPDFDFRDEHFFADPSLDMLCDTVPTLAKWNLQDPKALITVLREIISFYRRSQVGKKKLKFFVSY